ncbi:TM0106 family RecB-like putative nuclease [Candidatus Nitrospira allomarina]|uniref:TM0106 family RecB-like putative nuclease n=1 Tax=Candidatus Nitrospira allomarina TaxID=3020900 RepID=A0AA96JSA7_9BACT|nr:TM0106 family RecB-like putative nuclease [Candidatus Nitrospira allomarina]WNM57870.1 TM0106 family RecB-like putative nuclease [Candidatus Nitrospira allomarina]
MKKDLSGQLVFSPSDLICYLASPFASWMDRYALENPGAVTPDEETEDGQLIAQTGAQHERAVLDEFKSYGANLVEIPRTDPSVARTTTLSAIGAKVPIIYQAFLEHESFAGFADFLLLKKSGCYQVWDTKLARSPKPYYAIQLCCYSELLAGVTRVPMPEHFGLILGTKDRVEFRIEDFIHYYRRIKTNFLTMQNGFTGNLTDRPEPLPRADHGRWTSHAEKFFQDTDHLVQVAGITVSQLKKLKEGGIATVADLSEALGRSIRKLGADSLEKLVAQARLQCQTRADRTVNPDAPPRYEILPSIGANGEPVGLAALPQDHPADVFFDMEGYPLMTGGLEYLFGVCTRTGQPDSFEFIDWWAHNREEEQLAFEGFVGWVFNRWQRNPGMHIYHYAPYEVSAVRRLSTRHDTRQDEVDALLRNKVFVDLFQIVRHGLRLGENSYSLKTVERLYRPKRATEVATAADSIVQYARWIESQQPADWNHSPILKDIRDYNQDDCTSTAELLQWLRKVVVQHRITGVTLDSENAPSEAKELPPEVVTRLETAARLRTQGDAISLILADVVDFHRREEKPMWWRMFDRATATPEELRDDPACLQGICAVGPPMPEKLSLVQEYRFDPSQECKLTSGDKSKVMFTHNLDAKFTLLELDTSTGSLSLKIGKKALSEKFLGAFPSQGSLLPDEHVSATAIQLALTEVVTRHLSRNLNAPVTALLNRMPPVTPLQQNSESPTETAKRVAGSMGGGCLVIQGPPGTGKTFTASQVITSLLTSGKKIGVASNSHKAVMNLLTACGEAAQESGCQLQGIKVGGDAEDPLFTCNPGLHYIKDSNTAYQAYTGGVVGGTAWLFTRPEWEDALDFLFIDEAGQVALANAIAMARCAKNLVLLGDQMQLEQPVQGSHPGDAGLSALQYALKDLEASQPDSPIMHAVIPPGYGLFLGESRRMHPAVCRFISESMYEGRLQSHSDCARQKIVVPPGANGLIASESGILFSGVEHDGNIQQSEEEIERVTAIYHALQGRLYTDMNGGTKPLALEDFLFIAPYNAQVRALQIALPDGARVGSVDKFQGQEAPVCILSLCSSYGEYGSRGLAFILDRNRVNVAISRAQCLAIVVGDPRIAGTPPGSLDDMKLLNLFCKLTDATASR